MISPSPALYSPIMKEGDRVRVISKTSTYGDMEGTLKYPSSQLPGPGWIVDIGGDLLFFFNHEIELVDGV